jgi:3-deoxy-7-phosphoheptulonate synthase
MSMAAVAAGADGLIIEVHCNPQEALCDADQKALTPEMFSVQRTDAPLATLKIVFRIRK